MLGTYSPRPKPASPKLHAVDQAHFARCLAVQAMLLEVDSSVLKPASAFKKGALIAASVKPHKTGLTVLR